MVPILNSRLLISGFVIIKKYKYTFNFWRLKIKRFSYITRDCVCLVSSVYKCFVIRSFRAIRVKCLYRHYCEFVIFPVQTTALGIGHFSFFVAQNTIYNRLYRIKHIEKHHAGKASELEKGQRVCITSYRPVNHIIPRIGHYKYFSCPGLVYTTPEKFENGAFTKNLSNVYRLHYVGEI